MRRGDPFVSSAAACTSCDRYDSIGGGGISGSECGGGKDLAWLDDDRDADAYQAVVGGDVLPGILERDIPGLVDAHLMRADMVEDEEVEFTTIMWFESLDSVKNFMGADYQRAYVPENAQAVLKRFDAQAKHFHVLDYFAS